MYCCERPAVAAPRSGSVELWEHGEELLPRLPKFDNVDRMQEVWQLFDARHGVKKRCLIWHRVILAIDYSMSCLTSFFDAMSGVKKLPNFMHAINVVKFRQTSFPCRGYFSRINGSNGIEIELH